MSFSSSYVISPLFNIALSFDPISLDIKPPKGWTYEAITGGGTLYKTDSQQSFVILITEQPGFLLKNRVRLSIVLHGETGSQSLYDAATVTRKARSQITKEISRVFAGLRTVGEELIDAFKDRFQIELDALAIDLPPDVQGKGITDIARLYPKDESSAIEYLAMRRLKATEDGDMIWLYHKLKMPYPQAFSNTVLGDLPGFVPIYFQPFNMSLLEEAVKKFMLVDWKSELVKMLSENMVDIPNEAVSKEMIADAKRFLAQA